MRSELAFYGSAIVVTIALAAVAYMHMDTPQFRARSESGAFLSACKVPSIQTQYAEQGGKRVMVIQCERG